MRVDGAKFERDKREIGGTGTPIGNDSVRVRRFGSGDRRGNCHRRAAPLPPCGNPSKFEVHAFPQPFGATTITDPTTFGSSGLIAAPGGPKVGQHQHDD
jgi:hypothetical protein